MNKIDKIKLKLTLGFIRSIKPGWRANAVAKTVLFLLRALKPRKNVAYKTMEMTFPDISEAEKARLLDECYSNLAWGGAEVMAWQSNPQLIDDLTCEVEGKEHIDEAFSAGKGVIMITAHISNWEHAAAWIGRHFGATGIAQHSDNQFQKELVNALRATSGLKVMGKEEPMMHVVGLLRHKGVLGVVSDQLAGREGIKAPFFGHETTTAIGVALFSYMTGAPIIAGRCVRLGPFNLKMKFSEPIKWVKDKTKSRDEQIREITIKANEAIEDMIRETPGQWLWLHKRYKDIVKY